MVDYQGRSKRIITGKKFHPHSGKDKTRFGREPIETKIGETKKKIVRVRGANIKIKAFTTNYVNVSDAKAKSCKRVKIIALEENPASVDLKRRAIITLGAVVKTELGKVKITSRPGQDGQVNGILM